MHVRDLAGNAAWTPVTDPDQMIVHIVTIKVAEEVAPRLAPTVRRRPAAGRGDGRRGGARSHQEGQARQGRATQKDDKKK